MTGIEPGWTEDQGESLLMCHIAGGGKLAIWGDAVDRRNMSRVIDSANRHGWPVVVRCEVRDRATPSATRIDSTEWVRPESHLETD